MNQIITFKEAIKLVHPDSNPYVTNAGDKVRTVMLNKNDPLKLYNYLYTWGLIPGQTKEKKKKILIQSISHISSHTVYNGTIVIKHKKFNGYFEVQRTTAKRCYFTEKTIKLYGMKFCSVNSIRKAFKKI